MREVIQRAAAWLLLAEGSTRPAALMRIGLVLLLWARWASDFVLYQARQPIDVAIALSFYASTALLLLGLWTRFAAAWTAVTMLVVFYYLGVERGIEPYTHHHTWLLVAASVLIALTPCGRSFSLDRWRTVRRARLSGAEVPPERGPLWGQRLIAMQVSALYFWTAVDKCTVGFLSGERLQQLFVFVQRTSDRPDSVLFEPLMQAAALATVGLEFALAFGMWFRRTRPWVALAGIAMHAIIYVCLPVQTFSATMILLYLAFAEPTTIDRVIEDLTGASPARRTA